MSEDIYKLVEQFLNGELDPQQTLAFNKRLETDTELAEELRLRQDMHGYLINKDKKANFKEKLNNIGDDYFKETPTPSTKEIPLKPKRKFRWIAIAASIAAITIALYWVLVPKPNLYEQYALHEPLQLTEKSSNQSALIKKTEDSFNKGDYTSSLISINELLKNQPTELQFLMAKAICLLETNKTKEARLVFSTIASGQSVFKSEAQWYNALTYLKENKPELAKIELQKISTDDPDWASKAAQLIKKL